MSTIDTVESVRKPFELSKPFTPEEVTGLADSVRGRRRAALLAYAALLEAVNRPVTDEQVSSAAHAYVSHVPGYGGGCNTVQLRSALEDHMAALREEVGK